MQSSDQGIKRRLARFAYGYSTTGPGLMFRRFLSSLGPARSPGRPVNLQNRMGSLPSPRQAGVFFRSSDQDGTGYSLALIAKPRPCGQTQQLTFCQTRVELPLARSQNTILPSSDPSM